MIIDIIKNYKGNFIYDSSSIYDYDDLKSSLIDYANVLENKINDHENIVIYSDYNFYSICLLIFLTKFNVNIIPIIKTTQSEYEIKIKECFPTKIITIENNGNLIVKDFQLSKNIPSQFRKITKLNSTGLILFSSGTTGKPKLMIQNLTNLINSIPIPRRQKSLKFLLFLMFDHIGGINTLLKCLISGSPIVIPENRNPSTILRCIEESEVNVLPTSPTFLNMMLMDEKFSLTDFSSLKMITYGTERMPSILLDKLNKFLPSTKFLQTFGTSETGILKTISKSSDSLLFKIVDENNSYKIINGELYLRSKNSVSGYINHSNESFTDSGWYKTGDLVQEYENGYIKIIGRKNTIINVGGLKVLPSEVEFVLNSIDGVIDSTVYGEKNNITGNIVCANIYSKKNTDISKSVIKKICRDKLDKYKIPVKINFKNLDINSRGKKLKN